MSGAGFKQAKDRGETTTDKANRVLANQYCRGKSAP